MHRMLLLSVLYYTGTNKILVLVRRVSLHEWQWPAAGRGKFCVIVFFQRLIIIYCTYLGTRRYLVGSTIIVRTFF